MGSNRRELLKSIGLFGCGSILAGVSAGVVGYEKGKNKGQQEGYQEGIDAGIRRMGGIEPSTNDAKVRSENQEVTVQPDDHHDIQLTFTKEALLLYSVVADGDLDIVLLTKEDYEAYQNDGDPQYMVMHSDMDTSRAIRRGILQSGEYTLVLDNTAYGRENPEKPVEVGYKVEAYQREDN